MYYDTDQEINLTVGNEWVSWQVSTLNQNHFSPQLKKTLASEMQSAASTMSSLSTV